MLRTMIAATAALALAAPALAQDTDLLTGDPWECKAVSLVGNPVSDIMLGFGEGGEMLVSFFMSLPVQDNTVSVEFDLADFAAQRGLGELNDGEAEVADAVRRAFGAEHFHVEHAVDADLHVIAGDTDLLGNIDGDFL